MHWIDLTHIRKTRPIHHSIQARTHPEPVLERERRACHHEAAHHEVLLPPRRVQRPHLLLPAQELWRFIFIRRRGVIRYR